MPLCQYQLIEPGDGESIITTRQTTHANLMKEIHERIGCQITDTVNLRDGRVMLIDDLGHAKDLPLNHYATRLYWSVCRPGTSYVIRGAAAVAWDLDFAEDAERASTPLAPRFRPCQETGAVIGNRAFPCNRPSVGVVQYVGRDEGPYAMCLGHLDHNVRNRNAQIVTVLDADRRAEFQVHYPPEKWTTPPDAAQPPAVATVTELGMIAPGTETTVEPGAYEARSDGVYRDGQKIGEAIDLRELSPEQAGAALAAYMENVGITRGPLPAPPDVTGESRTPTPWALLCSSATCGPGGERGPVAIWRVRRVFLTEAEYTRQIKAPDARWVCPRCQEEAEWDDETYENAMDAAEATERGTAAPDPTPNPTAPEVTLSDDDIPW